MIYFLNNFYDAYENIIGSNLFSILPVRLKLDIFNN